MDQQSFLPTLSVADLQAEATEILAKAKERFRPVATFGLFSGGNDSTTVIRMSMDYLDAAVHIDTGIGIMDHGRTALDHVRACCEQWDLPLIVLKTPPSVYENLVLKDSYFNKKLNRRIERKGFPGPALHYIPYHHLKQHRLKTLQRDHSQRGEKILLVSGIWSKESKRRGKKYTQKFEEDHEARRCIWVKPALHFNADAFFSLRQELSLPQSEGAALIHKSGECLCGAMSDDPEQEELKEIEYWFPETGRRIRALEREAEKAGKPYCKWGHGKIQGEAKPVGIMCQGCGLFKD